MAKKTPASDVKTPAPETITDDAEWRGYIAAALWHTVYPAHIFLPDPNNTLDHDQKDLAHTAASLSRFQQNKHIVVRAEDLTVCAGNGMLEATKILGRKYIAANIKSMDLDEFVNYGIADNATGRRAYFNRNLLVLTQAQLDKKDGVYPPGIDDEFIINVNKEIEKRNPQDGDTENDAFGEFDDTDLDYEHQCPSCGYEW